MKKILLIGSTGQVGQELLTTLPSLGEVIPLTRQQLDLTQSDSLAATIEKIEPNIIVNAAAYTAVDRAETDAETAKTINATAPKIIAQTAQKIAAQLVHISTDYVFDGTKYTPYLESDATNPLGVYGKTKLLGEQAIINHCQNYFILRTAWVYGAKGHGNFVKTMLRLGATKEELKIVADQIGSPTWSYDIAKAIVNLLQANQINSGIYHFTNSGVASWYDFAVAIFEEAGNLGFPLTINSILPITTAQYPTPAQRPHYSVLSQEKYIETLGVYPPYWRNSLRKMLQEWQSLT